MNFKKLLLATGCFVVCTAFAGCGMSAPTPEGGNNQPDYSDGNITDRNEVNIPEPDETEHDFNLISTGNGKYTYRCPDCNEEETVVISCESGTKNAYSVEGNTITFKGITEKSAYDISGAFHGNIVIDAGDSYKFELQLSGFEMYSHTECPVNILSGDKVTLSAKKSTENYVYDMRSEVSSSEVSASIYAECDLDIQGKGILAVKSVNNNGIHTKDDLSVKNLSLQVDCKDNALKGNDSVTVESGNLVLIARTGDGIKTANSDISSKGNQRGTVAITGGDILIYSACDGIDAAYDAVIDESTASVSLQIFTDKYSKYSEEVTATAESVYYVRYNSTTYKYSLKFFNDETDAVWYNSSSYTTVSSSGGPNRSTYYYYSVTKPGGYSYVQLYVYNSAQQQGQSENCVYTSGKMAMNNSYDTIAVQSSRGSLSHSWTNYTTANQGGGMGGPGGGGWGGMNDGNTDKGDHSTKGIKAGNAIAISAGTVTVSAYDDALHANNDGTLENGSAPLGNVAISGGSLTLRSNDDGIHADNKVRVSGGSVNVIGSYEGVEGKTVEISGGSVSVVSSDDGINGTATSGTSITVSGGNLFVYAGGDGVDSNSTTSYAGISFEGGKSVIISTGNSDSSIDTERGYKYSGGYVIGICRSGGMSSEATNCSNFSSVGTSKTLSLQKDAYLVAEGIATVKIPVAVNALVVCLGKTNANISSVTSTNYNLDANGVYWN